MRATTLGEVTSSSRTLTCTGSVEATNVLPVMSLTRPASNVRNVVFRDTPMQVDMSVSFSHTDRILFDTALVRLISMVVDSAVVRRVASPASTEYVAELLIPVVNVKAVVSSVAGLTASLNTMTSVLLFKSRLKLTTSGGDMS